MKGPAAYCVCFLLHVTLLLQRGLLQLRFRRQPLRLHACPSSLHQQATATSNRPSPANLFAPLPHGHLLHRQPATRQVSLQHTRWLLQNSPAHGPAHCQRPLRPCHATYQTNTPSPAVDEPPVAILLRSPLLPSQLLLKPMPFDQRPGSRLSLRCLYMAM